MESPVIHELDEDWQVEDQFKEVNGHLGETEVDGKAQLSSSTTKSESSSSTGGGDDPRSSGSKKSSRKKKSKSSREQTPSESSAKERTSNAEINKPVRNSGRGNRQESQKRARARFYRKLSKNPYSSPSSSGEEDHKDGEVNGNIPEGRNKTEAGNGKV